MVIYMKMWLLNSQMFYLTSNTLIKSPAFRLTKAVTSLDVYTFKIIPNLSFPHLFKFPHRKLRSKNL